MTRFDPKKSHKTPQEWSEEAYRATSQNNLQLHVIGGLVLGVMVAGATTPVTGGLIAAYTLWTAWTRSGEIQRNQEAIIDKGCVAQVLEGDSFQDYLDQCGHEVVMDELKYAQQRGLSMSNDALDYLEDKGALPAQKPAENTLLQQVGSVVQTVKTATKGLGALGGVKEGTKVIINTFNPLDDSQIDIIGEMTDRIGNMLVIGIPGSGKGMLVSNAIREAIKKHPDLKIFVIDPKADPKEAGYFNIDGLMVEKYACMDAKPSAVAVWAERAFDLYAEYARNNHRTLLILDEGTMLGNKLSQAKSTLLVDKLTALTSGGDSAGRNVWFMAQTPYVGASSLNLSTSSQMTSIVIASQQNIGALTQWKAAKTFKALSLDEVQELIDNSETNRAVYFGKTGKWYCMPPLNNYSGYDRDRREFLPGHEPQDTVKIEDKESPVIQEQTEVKDKVVISAPAQKVLEWLQANRVNQWVRYNGRDRDQSFINLARKNGYTSQDAIFDELITELLLAETIDLDEAEGAFMLV